MGIHGPRCALLALITLIIGSGRVARADGANGWGFVPGARIGAVRGSFDGTAAMPAAQSGWGYTTEVHVDALRTFGRDRRAIGLSLGYLSQTHGDFVDGASSTADAFEHTGMGLSLMLSTVVTDRTSLTLRGGWVAGPTQTGAGAIDAALKRFGLEVTRIVQATSFLHLAGHLAVEYFTGGDGTRGYDAFAVVVGGTFVLAP